ncbi:hypothetical protein GQ53DRAFT_89649 [Thozetella sp. PMI_491]|nr:hypothetical protein GQ53DRAFT_89649 [Thozetella sp. PMI_491]
MRPELQDLGDSISLNLVLAALPTVNLRSRPSLIAKRERCPWSPSVSVVPTSFCFCLSAPSPHSLSRRTACFSISWLSYCHDTRPTSRSGPPPYPRDVLCPLQPLRLTAIFEPFGPGVRHVDWPSDSCELGTRPNWLISCWTPIIGWVVTSATDPSRHNNNNRQVPHPRKIWPQT